MNKAKADPNYKVIAENRRARFDYAIENDLECGIVLLGSEVKSLRNGGKNKGFFVNLNKEDELRETN